MKRDEFIKEMGNSLLQTVKSVYEPFLHEDLKKVEEAADKALGISWIPFMKKGVFSSELEMTYLYGKPIIVTHYGTNIQAINGVCPVCSNIIILTTLYSSGKCLNCQKEYNFKTQTGELKLDSFPIKTKDDMYFIAFRGIGNKVRNDA